MSAKLYFNHRVGGMKVKGHPVVLLEIQAGNPEGLRQDPPPPLQKYEFLLQLHHAEELATGLQLAVSQSHILEEKHPPN